MAVFLPENDEIYFSKTREYFQEVLSSYSIGNYRSATVMLYSVAICDILFKLQELKDMFNDTIANDILKEVDKSRNAHDRKSKSSWEKEFIDNVYKKTELLDLEAYTNLNHLYDYRNFSAHPALNENYELIEPSKEVTIANIKNILKDILIKPPIFIKNVINMLTEDLKDKRELYEDNDNQLATYLNNKYYSKMPEPMKCTTLKAFWKFCFCLPDDVNCIENTKINRNALKILIDSFPQKAKEYIQSENQIFTVANDERCMRNLIILISGCQEIYKILSKDTKYQLDSMIEKDINARALAWFKFNSSEEHLKDLKVNTYLSIDKNNIRRLISHYSDRGDMDILIDFFIFYYGRSRSFNSADERFGLVIEPFIDKMKKNHFEELIKVTDANTQIYNRGWAYDSNNKIMCVAKNILDKDFDYSKYSHFRFDNSIINPDTENAEE